jgi:hypothetical protein
MQGWTVPSQFIEVNQRNVSTSGSNLIDARFYLKMDLDYARWCI